MIEISVPATTANIGPGYDTLGLSLNLYNEVTFENHYKTFELMGCDKQFCNKENLIYKSFREAERILELKPTNVKINIKSKIPVSRGLGSSAACVVSGVLGAYGIHNKDIDKKEILEIATNIEGHPDNIAPCIYGGLTASFIDDDKIFTKKFNISNQLIFYAFIPNFKLSTSNSRMVLPEKINHVDAVYNLSRLPILISALESGNLETIKSSIKDRLHQPYREKLIDEVEEVKKIIKRQEDSVYYISGAGPTIMCISKNKELKNTFSKELQNLKNSWKIKRLITDNIGMKYRRK